MAERNDIRDRHLLEEVTENRRVPSTSCRPGFASRLTGIDGRFNGDLRPFPGFVTFHRLGDVEATGTDYNCTGVTFIRGVSFNVGSSKVWTGYVARVSITSPAETRVVLEWYDGTDWFSQTIESSLDSGIDGSLVTGDMDVATVGRLIYVFREGREPILVYFDEAEAFTVVKDTGPGTTPTKPALTASATAPSNPPENPLPSVPLTAGKYNVAYRFYDTVTGRYSQLSDFAEITDDETPSGVDPSSEVLVLSSDAYVTVTVNLLNEGVYTNASTWAGKYDRLIIYRSVRTQDVGGTFQGGILFTDAELVIDDSTDSIVNASGEAVWAFSIPDLPLTAQEPYDSAAVHLSEMPRGPAAIIEDGTLFVASKVQTGDEATATATVRWSNTISDSPELFPILYNRRNLGAPGAVPLLFRKAGSVILGFSASEMYFVAKVGADVEIRSMHKGYGVLSGDAATSYEDAVYAVTPQGVIAVASNGQMQPLTALDRVVLQDWASSISAVKCVHDSAMGCVMLLNPTTDEMALLWLNTSKLTSLEGVSFANACVGVDPTDNDSLDRAIMVSDDGKLHRPDNSLEKPDYGWWSNGNMTERFVEGATGLTEISADPITSFTRVHVYQPILSQTPWGTTISQAQMEAVWRGMPVAFIGGAAAGQYGIVLTASYNTGTSTAILTLDRIVPNVEIGKQGTGLITNAQVLLNPVIVRIRTWPFASAEERSTFGTAESFRRHTLYSMGTWFERVVGSLASTVGYWFANIYRGDDLTPIVEAVRPVAGDGTAVISVEDGLPEHYASVKCTGGFLIPELLTFSSGVYWRLKAIDLRGDTLGKDVRRRQ